MDSPVRKAKAKATGPSRGPEVGHLLNVPLDQYLQDTASADFVSNKAAAAAQTIHARGGESGSKGRREEEAGYDIVFLDPACLPKEKGRLRVGMGPPGVSAAHHQAPRHRHSAELHAAPAAPDLPKGSIADRRRAYFTCIATSMRMRDSPHLVRAATDSVLGNAVIKVPPPELKSGSWTLRPSKRPGLALNGRPVTGAYLGTRLVPRLGRGEVEALEGVALVAGVDPADVPEWPKLERQKNAGKRTPFVKKEDVVYAWTARFNDAELLPEECEEAGRNGEMLRNIGRKWESRRELERKLVPKRKVGGQGQQFQQSRYEDPWAYSGPTYQLKYE